MLNYRFETKNILNEQVFLIHVEPPYQMLYDLSSGFLQTTAGAEEVLMNIKKVQRGEMDTYSFGGSDYCTVDVFSEKSIVIYDFGESQAVIPTAELVRLLEDWAAYLRQNL